MRRAQSVLFFIPALLSAFLHAQTRPALAILPFTGTAAEDAKTTREFFLFEDEIVRAFTLIPLDGAEGNLMEGHLSRQSALIDADAVAELGRRLNAEYVLTGHVTALDTGRLLLIALVNVKELRQIAGNYQWYEQVEDMADILTVMAKETVDAARQDAAPGISGQPRLAALPVNVFSDAINRDDAELLTQILITELANSGRYAVFPRIGVVEGLIKERGIDWRGMADPANIRAVTEAAGVQYLLSVSVRKLGTDNYFSASILNAEGAGQDQEGREKYRTVGDGLAFMPGMVRSLSGETSAQAPSQRLQVPDDMVLVEGGTFRMGSADWRSNEMPAHSVTVKSFYMGKTEVTQKDWQKIMGTSVARQRDAADESRPLYGEGDDYPMYYVNWYEAVEYCNKRSLGEGLTPAYRGNGDNTICDFTASGYRLPTEAEWEYAAKGGGKDRFVFEYAGGDSPDSVAWYNDNSGSAVHPVGTKEPNSLGLYDMSGNVYEWCWDWFGAYTNAVETDPEGPSGSSSPASHRVSRGGSLFSDAQAVRSAARAYDAPSTRSFFLGFRVVRSRL